MTMAKDILLTSSRKRRNTHDDATLTYIRRVLGSAPCSAAQSIKAESTSTPLPPLTSSNEVDVQLYALVAVILSNFVQVWYNRITPDQQFVTEIVHIVAHCTTGLEQRLRQVDLEELLLDELPDLLIHHNYAFRAARLSQTQSREQNDVRSRFLAIRPHVALMPPPVNASAAVEQQENELAWCLLIVNRVLPLLLPPEDLQNPCLDVLVSEVFSDLIFRGGLCSKASEPWIIWDGMAKLLSSTATRAGEGIDRVPARLDGQSDVISSTKLPFVEQRRRWIRRRFQTISELYWVAMHFITVLWGMLRASLVIITQASTIPKRTGHTRRHKTRGRAMPDLDNHPMQAVPPVNSEEKRPILAMHIWSCISQLLLLDQRSPWLSGLFSLSQWMLLSGPGRLCDTNSRMDRLMSMTFQDRVLTTTWLPPILKAARTALFPNNALAPARIPPTREEIARIKRDCAESIVGAIPRYARQLFFATDNLDEMRADVEAELDLLADPVINKHLIISVVELVAVRLFPELAEGEGRLGRGSSP